MKYETDDLRIRELKELRAPRALLGEYPLSERASQTVHEARCDIHNILHGEDRRLLVVVGPCSIHDVDAAREYAGRLAPLALELRDQLLIVMRVYFEKPRTTVGWKGLINDPRLDDSFEINEGLRLARHLLADLADLGLPAGTEYLDLISPQYVADLIAWGAIGARTTESQSHRELASGLSCPVGFKNATDGTLQVAVDAIVSAAHSHHFLSVTKAGRSAIFATTGNADCHVILRGGKTPNYDAAGVDDVAALLEKSGLPVRVMIDASHANSRKKPARQLDVCRYVADQVARGDERIFGLMLESHLLAGRQDIENLPLVYGQSVTDACIDWQDTELMLRLLAEAAATRRTAAARSGVVASVSV
ncbi:MAG: 3-deoxy-7-phosphoheptulonate synthase [Gammaproteobacteria bacterium]|nr:3-deoxy-7-phosphoheptulonate synthase [Gammaproteobacteria bacterium]